MGHRIRNAAVAGAGAACAWGAVQLWRKSQADALRARLPGGTKILILGSGFGGMNVASELARLLPDVDSADILLVDQHGNLLFTPMLTEVAGGEVDPRHVVAHPRHISKRTTFVHASVDDIDLPNRRVAVTRGGRELGLPELSETLIADHLVIALGSVTNFHGVPGLEDNALTIKTVQEANAIRSRALELMERATLESNEESRREMLTFVIGGGGYTGVETTAALNDLVRETAKRSGRIRQSEIRVLLVEPGGRLMPETSPELASYAQQKLEQRGAEVLLGTKVTGATSAMVELEGGRRIPARTIIWAGGVKPNPLIGKLDCRKGKHGGIVVDETCAVPDHPGIWAIGDCAEIPNGDKIYAPTAQNATREGKHVARNVVRVLAGQQPLPFRYQPAGELALTGRHSGVARIYGIEFSGIPAWMLWRSVYLLKMPQTSQRFRIGLDWLLDVAFGRNLADVPY